ncbi:FUSC family protein [Vibrio natriegens]|uniref:Fusaric acid resistance protein n=1 Tax=Vibrio natriegens NBRC 15636 = ATCC 14048 = DSM 759 TaxID=1219067 RepID=A0AAN0Y634_VIBNA|nr:FUSC family protein [Vibrio natriegens]ALR18568.1 fusaric acid resistance protein [Vibrio natriegens NBRC 15636 = ATCC 14048 = DSM 759]ANQ14534.1 fusaric acid resistance protein [Vibrio natriegens NBRC 15636 = ATCC 14048 = DSM 759]EPM39566.1 fusaric acid resistance protein [Vibrio natriegens NBRC 15636 = ATCC 14048 = DSM 759]MDX6028508.1 FUSC family protein [Vibrio natriegens NBRC 15636 = ATCC 14048 = DSM 759]UUI13170.1 FUSC family protein [Vibrio natriegens]
MLNASSKEAIKVALSIVIALSLALWFQWEKPYWAAIAVVVMALNESYAHSIHKGHNRVWGTLVGIAYALFLIGTFPQDPFLFLSFLTMFLGLCIFMSSDEKYGYIFSMAFTVCSIVACMGQFDDQTIFHFAILRLQETVLGVITFSVVYRIVWPINTEQNFIQNFENSRTLLLEELKNKHNFNIEALEANAGNINKLYQLLNLPLKDSYQLRQHRRVWLDRVNEMTHIQERLLSRVNNSNENSAEWKVLAEKLENFYVDKPQTSLIGFKNSNKTESVKISIHQKKRTLTQHFKDDRRKVFHGVSMFVTSLLVWIYLPVPGGSIFPMIAAAFSCILPTMPPSVLKDAFFGVIGTGTVILLEYVFLMPLMTELWQLALFYFINTIVIWEVFSAPKMMIHRILGINLLVVLTSGALNLTPTYKIETPILMLTNILILLLIGKLFSDLFCKPQNLK